MIIKAPSRPQPELVEAPLGVKEHWFETFRRVTVAPLGNGCYLVSMDVYAAGCPCREAHGGLILDPIALLYCSLQVKLDEGEERSLEVVCLKCENQLETISVRFTLCGSEPERYYLWKVYRAVVKALEGRDPEVEPLDLERT